DKLNVLTRSHALQDVIWSTAVQHGGAARGPQRALATLTVKTDDPNFDRNLIVALYNERRPKIANGGLANFPKVTAPAVQKSLANRFKQEVKDALAMLDDET